MPYVDPSVIDQVKQVDLFTYLRDNEPDELVKISRNTYCTQTHDSLKISNGRWYWWSRGIGGKSALDYLIKVREMSFMDAVQLLIGRNTVVLPPPMRAEPAPLPPKPFKMPVRSRSTDAARTYLTSRGIDPEIVDECIGRGIVYETRHGNYKNTVFLGLDSHGIPRYAMVRARFGDAKWEIEGSEKRHSFRLNAKIKIGRVHIFESAIDVLSYATHLNRLGLDWRKENLLSIAGVPPVCKDSNTDSIPQAIIQYLADNPHTTTMCLRLDNDKPGLNAADRIATSLYGRYEMHILPPKTGKDWNDFIQAADGPNRHSTNSHPKKNTPQRERA